MTLGPALEFCLHAAHPVALPAGLAGDCPELPPRLARDSGSGPILLPSVAGHRAGRIGPKPLTGLDFERAADCRAQIPRIESPP